MKITNHLKKSILKKKKGFWQVDQPDAEKGQCVRASTANADQSWALSSCESLLPFVCRAKACPKSEHFNILFQLFDANEPDDEPTNLNFFFF